MSPAQSQISLTLPKQKCNGLPTCTTCQVARTPCGYSRPKKRGPKPAQSQHPSAREPTSSTSPATNLSEGYKSPGIIRAYSHSDFSNCNSRLSSNTIPASFLDPLSVTPESQAQTAAGIHLDLLAGLLVAAPSDTAASIAHNCILFYNQYVFGAVSLCHGATLRATTSRFFTSPTSVHSYAEDRAIISGCFAADDEQHQIGVLRSYTVLTALCASVTYVLPESLLPNKRLVAPLFLRAARETLRIYENYDLEHPDSSSLSIRMFLSSAIQISTGASGVAFHVLNEAGLIAMRMRLYNEISLQGRDPIEQSILRNAFWQLYICDKTALVMKTRSVAIHESLFETELTLETNPRSSVPLFEIGQESNATEIEDRLVEGFHIIRRLWAMAAQVVQAMESNSRRTWDEYADMVARRESIPRLSTMYFEMITLTNWTRSPEESSPGALDEGQHLCETLLRQRTTYLISLHCIKVFLLDTAINCNMTEVMGLSAGPLALSMRQIELAQDFLNVLESVPFLHLQVEGEQCAEKIRRVGSLLLELAHTTENDGVKDRASQCAMRLIDMLARLNSKASDVLGRGLIL